MSTEITYTDEVIESPPPVVEAKDPKPDKNGKKPDKKADEKTDAEEKAITSPVMKQIRNQEDLSLKEMLDGLGPDGSFSIRITRKWPEYATEAATGKRIQVAGYLTKVDKPVDEEWLMNMYGGGTYHLQIRKRDAKGKFGEAADRTITIAGDPNLDALPRVPGAAPSGLPTTPESGPLVTKVLDHMSKQLEKAEDRADRAGDRRSGDDQMFEIMREQLRETREANARLIARMEALQERILAPPPPTAEEKVKDRLFDKLIDQDSARIATLRAQYESEIRQLKDSALENERRLHDRFDRDRQEMRNGNERELANLKQSHETMLQSIKSSADLQIQAAKHSFETALSAKSTAFDTQKEVLQAEIKRLERDNGDLRDDLKELRGKKEKTIIEQVKELEVIKDALGLDDGEKTTAEKLLDGVANSDLLPKVAGMFGGQQPPAAAVPTEPVRPPRPRVVRDKESGQKFIVSADGRHMRPAKPPPVPGQPQIPDFPPEVVQQVVGYLERSFTAGTEPEIVAQTSKASVPEPILMAIRDVGGVDAFLSKVAKLPSSSPLSSTQAGRNWIKKFGKALIGE